MTNIKEISLILENCEVITIPGKYIGDIYLRDIRTSVERVACNAIVKMNTCHEFGIEIHGDANHEPYLIFGHKPTERDMQTIFDRLLAYKDITQVEITFCADEEYGAEKEETLHYHLHWADGCEYTNMLQSAKLSRRGDLYIVVSDSGKSVTDVFEEAVIPMNEEECKAQDEMTDFKFEMYAIGDKNWEEEQESLKSCEEKNQ